MKWAIPLLADSSPILRMRVLRDLLGRSDDDPEVRELRGLCDSDPLAANLLGAQNPDGSWSDGRYSAGGATSASLDATAQALTRLGYLGYDLNHPAVQRGAEYVLSQQEPDGSWPLFKSHERDGGSVDTGYDLISLQTSMPLRGLAMCGYATDPRAEKAYDWLLAQRLLDGAWPTGISGGNYGYVAGYRCLAHSRWGCRTNTTAALICLAHHPKRRTSDDTRRALDLLLGRETRERHHVGMEVARMIGVENTSGRFTYFARFDLALVLDLCWRIAASREDTRIADMVGFILRWQGAFGLWEYVPRPEASRWLTFDLLRSLANLSADSDWQSTEPQTPFQPYTKTNRRY